MRLFEKRLMLVAFCCSILADVTSASGIWERPKTTRRYVQGPLAERVIVYWREGKITVGEVRHEHDWKKTVYDRPGATPQAYGVWLLQGDQDEPFDFRQAQLRTESDATPIHGQSWTLGGMKVDLESCTPFGRKPSAHLRVKVSNLGYRVLSHRLSLMVRSGEERQLVFSAPDLYAVYAPVIGQWRDVPASWRKVSENVWSDGERFLTASSASPFDWDAGQGLIRFEARVEPGSCRTFDFVLGEGNVEQPDYETHRDRTRADWQRELMRVKDRTDLIRLMTVQMLQCFSCARNHDYILPRQGGLQRWVWPGDQKNVSAALGLLGYNEYVERTIDFYFNEYSKESGEFGPFGNGWACDTASVLEIFARYCLDAANQPFWRRYRDRAAKAFDWIASKRRESIGRPNLVSGLFPPMKATDAGEVFQAWGNTDINNLLAMEYMARAAEKLGDSRAAEFRDEANAYREVIDGIMAHWRKVYEGKDVFHIPLDPKGTLEPELRANNYFYSHPARFLALGFVSDEEAVRLRKWLIQEGYAHPCGLYQANPTPKCWDTGEPTPPEIANNVWYTTMSELSWFQVWKRMGREDLARQTLDAAIRYGTTEEGCVGERFCSVNPWYFPWSPNASGAGRIVQMLLMK